MKRKKKNHYHSLTIASVRSDIEAGVMERMERIMNRLYQAELSPQCKEIMDHMANQLIEMSRRCVF